MCHQRASYATQKKTCSRSVYGTHVGGGCSVPGGVDPHLVGAGWLSFNSATLCALCQPGPLPWAHVCLPQAIGLLRHPSFWTTRADAPSAHGNDSATGHNLLRQEVQNIRSPTVSVRARPFKYVEWERRGGGGGLGGWDARARSAKVRSQPEDDRSPRAGGEQKRRGRKEREENGMEHKNNNEGVLNLSHHHHRQQHLLLCTLRQD